MADKRVALYARVSTKEQDAAPQLERLRDWAKANDYQVVKEVVELASGRLVRRPGFDEVMVLARGHHVHAVATCKVDRWARSMIHMASTVRELVELGVEFHAVDQGITTRKGDPASTFTLHLLGAFAEMEASLISERTKEALRAKAPGQGPGRHRKGCGVQFACPTKYHRDQRPNGPLARIGKGYAEVSGKEAPPAGGLPSAQENDRLPEAT